MSDSESDEGGESSLTKITHAARHPYRFATSKPAQRAYIGTFLAALATVFLLGASAVAYVLFYYNYVPDIGAEHLVYLQFGNGNPYGTVYLPNTLVPQQRYDISLSMHLPRTPPNLAAGNFMIDMGLLTPSMPLLSPVQLLQSSVGAANTSELPMTRSRRAAILTHQSRLVETSHLVANMLWYVIGWKRESERLDVTMFEGIEFARGMKNVPDRIQVVIEADEKMQFYEVKVRVRAEFRGLRWIMYNHRILSFFFFTGSFFSVAMSSALVAYFLFGSQAPAEPGSKQIKSESETDDVRDPLSTTNLSDTPRRFPAIGKREGLTFEGRPQGSASAEDVRIKREEEEIERTTGIEPLAAEADDEDEEETWRDSGIGTGRESDRHAGSRRRKSLRDFAG